MSKVAFLKIKKVSKDEIRKTVHKAMKLGNWKKYIKGKKIFVKINGISDQLVPSQCTSPWVIDAVLEKLKDTYPKSSIFMGDADLAAAEQLNKAAKLWGFYDIARKYDAVAINADATQEDTLDESEIKKADVLVTTTNDDAVNLMVVSLAKNKGVKHLVSVVNQEESRPMYLEKNVKMVKSPNVVMAEHLYKSIKHPSVEEYMNVGKYAEIFRIPIATDSKFSGKTIKKHPIPMPY